MSMFAFLLFLLIVCVVTIQMNGEPSQLSAEHGTLETEITTSMEEQERAMHEETNKEQQEMMDKVTSCNYSCIV